MAENSKIEWTHHTFNAWVGCERQSPACDHCYAEGWAKRTGHPELWSGVRRRTTEDYWRQPIKWNAKAEAAGVRQRVFCCSLADVFDTEAAPAWRHDLWHRIEQTPWLDWLLLTKRSQNIAGMLPDPATGVQPWGDGWPNVWLGTTVENQEEADKRIPDLLAVPARVRFLSCEPLLGPVDIRWAMGHPMDIATGFLRRGHFSPGLETLRPLDWIIAGGESGPGARPMHPDWPRDLRDQCWAAGVSFFFKQHGNWKPIAPVFGDPTGAELAAIMAANEDRCSFIAPDGSIWPPASVPPPGTWFVENIGKPAAGALLDGREWRETPA